MNMYAKLVIIQRNLYIGLTFVGSGFKGLSKTRLPCYWQVESLIDNF